MPVELDHVFVCASPGAPEADELLRFGLHEGPPNRHPGQGTACRRFSFRNAMLELIWVSNEIEARNEPTGRTRLWERWSGRDAGACPFGICLRPAGTEPDKVPFPFWDYRPSYLPDPLFMGIGEGGLAEPMWIYLSFLRRSQREKYFTQHPAGVAEVTGLTLTCAAPLDSHAAKAVLGAGIFTTKIGSRPLLEMEFDHARRHRIADFRPHLPLVFRS